MFYSQQSLLIRRESKLRVQSHRFYQQAVSQNRFFWKMTELHFVFSLSFSSSHPVRIFYLRSYHHRLPLSLSLSLTNVVSFYHYHHHHLGTRELFSYERLIWMDSIGDLIILDSAANIISFSTFLSFKMETKENL